MLSTVKGDDQELLQSNLAAHSQHQTYLNVHAEGSE